MTLNEHTLVVVGGAILSLFQTWFSIEVERMQWQQFHGTKVGWSVGRSVGRLVGRSKMSKKKSSQNGFAWYPKP